MLRRKPKTVRKQTSTMKRARITRKRPKPIKPSIISRKYPFLKRYHITERDVSYEKGVPKKGDVVLFEGRINLPQFPEKYIGIFQGRYSGRDNVLATHFYDAKKELYERYPGPLLWSQMTILHKISITKRKGDRE